VTLSDQLIDALIAQVGSDAVIRRPAELRVYECDGYTLEKSAPDVVVLPSSTK
jgi:glycolate oxidase